MASSSGSDLESMAATISERIARLYLDTFGKGPVDVETHINENVVTTILRDVFTVAEKSMLEQGQGDSVLGTRMHWQAATDERFRGAVAETTGRTVLSAVSGFDIDQEIASEVFILAPA